MSNATTPSILRRRLRVRVTKPKLERSEAYERAKPKYFKVIILMLPFAVLFTIFGIFLTSTPVEPFSRSSMLLLLAGVLCGIPIVLSLLSAAVPHNIRIAASAPLRFMPTFTVWMVGAVAALLVTLAGAVGVWAQLAPGVDAVSFSRVWQVGVWLLLTGGASLLIYVLSRFRVLRGLELGPSGLRWWKGTEEVVLPWKQVYVVQLATTGSKDTVRIVEIIDRDSRKYELRPELLGSDPHVVAEVLRYFVKHPEHRESLNDPHAALALITEPL